MAKTRAASKRKAQPANGDPDPDPDDNDGNNDSGDSDDSESSDDGNEDLERENKKLIKLLTKLVTRNSNANADIAKGITTGLAKNQHSQDTEKDIVKVSMDDKSWKVIDFLRKVSNLRTHDNYNRCWEVLLRKLDTVDEDIRVQAQATIDMGSIINEAQWNQILKLIIYPEGEHDLDIIIRDMSDDLAGYKPKIKELLSHKERATTMWRCTTTAYAWSDMRPTKAQHRYHNNAYIQGLCHAIPNDKFARKILKKELKNSKSPRTVATVQDYYNIADQWLSLDKGIKKHLPDHEDNLSNKRRKGRDKENNQPTLAWSNAMIQNTLRTMNSGRAATENAIMSRLNNIEKANGAIFNNLQSRYYEDQQHQQLPTRPPMIAFTPARTQASHQQFQTAQQPQLQQPQQHGAAKPFQAPCRDFARGTCERGPNCRFSHDNPGPPGNPPPATTNEAPSDRTCTNFIRGHCRFGTNCRFRHTRSELCRKCGTDGHQYGPNCPQYSGCYRCNGPHYASKCASACPSCQAPGRSPCMSNCSKKPTSQLFRRGNQYNNRT